MYGFELNSLRLNSQKLFQTLAKRIILNW